MYANYSLLISICMYPVAYIWGKFTDQPCKIGQVHQMYYVLFKE